MKEPVRETSNVKEVKDIRDIKDILREKQARLQQLQTKTTDISHRPGRMEQVKNEDSQGTVSTTL